MERHSASERHLGLSRVLYQDHSRSALHPTKASAKTARMVTARKERGAGPCLDAGSGARQRASPPCPSSLFL